MVANATRPSQLRLLAVVALAGVGCFTVLVTASRSVQGGAHRVLNPSFASTNRALYERDRCIEHTMRTTLPRGARLYVRRSQDPYWRQGLTVLATPWLRVVSRRSEAEYVVSEIAGVVPPDPNCRPGLMIERARSQ